MRLGLFVKFSKTRSTTIKTVKTNPLRVDTDGDALSDGAEVKGITVRFNGKLVFKSNPRATDSDKDGLSDKAEVTGARNTRFGHEATNPHLWNSDRDGHSSDLREVRHGSNPNVKVSSPRHPRKALRRAR